MPFDSWRGTMGLIKPTHRPGSLEETIRLLPEGIGVVPLTVGFRTGAEQEFRDALASIEDCVRQLVEIGVELVAPGGAPPLMVHGYDGEQRILDGWRHEYGVPVISAGGTQVDAMHALGVHSFVGLTYFGDRMNTLFADYFTAAGFDVKAMAGVDVAFDQVQTLSVHRVYRAAKAAFLAAEPADAIYLLGSGWRVLDVIELLEQDLQVPVIHAVPARVWSTQQHFRVLERRAGFGRLLDEQPRLLSSA